jgi:hypothetical protein
MKNWKSILGILLIFVFGMITGGLLTARIIDKRVRHFLQGGPNAVAELIETRLNRGLDLDAAQRAGVANAITRARDRLKSARQEVQPKVDEAFAQAEREIRDLLRPEQAAKFDGIISRARERWRR